MMKIGRAWIDKREILAGTRDTWTITYEVGAYGIDDGGEVLISRRDVCDSELPQFDHPNQPGYVHVTCTGEAGIRVQYIPDRLVRPWKSCLSVKVFDGSLKQGDCIRFQYGSKPGQGPGYRIQTFRESEHMFKIWVDCAGSGNFYPLDESPWVTVKGGYPHLIEAVVPSQAKVEQPFDATIRVLDSWGNIAELYSGNVTFALGPIEKTLLVENGFGQLRGLVLEKEGLFYGTVSDKGQNLSGTTNPLCCLKQEPGQRLLWGDMHGQTKETVGTGTLDEYFTFGRDQAALDFCAWQGNDFQVTDACWADVNEAVKKYHRPGAFVTFLGYEWSGNVPTGGDYNIYYLHDDQPIYRSYHWQIGMDDPENTERNPVSRLWDTFRDRTDMMAIPHVGGRHGNLDFYDPEISSLLEIHSHHGTFEWFMADALKKGLQPGVIAASDDHTCRPGLSFPTQKTSRGFVSFDVKGGYTAVYADDLTRESLWKAFRKRHCYGTTGERILLSVSCGNHMMGDAFTVSEPPTITADVIGTAGIRDVELLRGLTVIDSYASRQPVREHVVQIIWHGVRSKDRRKKTCWDGSLTVQNGRITGWKTIAFNNPQDTAQQWSNQLISWQSNTSGNYVGIEVTLDPDSKCTLTLDSEPVSFAVTLDDLKEKDQLVPAGGVNQQVKIALARETSSQHVQLSATDVSIQPGVNPYWIRVTQQDGHQAWSSPMYITWPG